MINKKQCGRQGTEGGHVRTNGGGPGDATWMGVCRSVSGPAGCHWGGWRGWMPVDVYGHTHVYVWVYFQYMTCTKLIMMHTYIIHHNIIYMYKCILCVSCVFSRLA